jgi:hypothetical protein
MGIMGTLETPVGIPGVPDVFPVKHKATLISVKLISVALILFFLN